MVNTVINHPKDAGRNAKAMFILILIALVKSNAEQFNLKMILLVAHGTAMVTKASPKARGRAKKMILGIHGQRRCMCPMINGIPPGGIPKSPNGGDGTIMNSYDKLFVH